MVGDRLINAKELLIQHNELMSKKMQEIKKIKSFDEYSVWVKENKQTLSERIKYHNFLSFWPWYCSIYGWWRYLWTREIVYWKQD